MNSKQRAELQRKLTLKAVPRPPAGLAERIKSDIPKYLQAEPDRFSGRSLAFNLRIAASILLVVGAASIVCSFFSLGLVIDALITTRILVQFIGQIGALTLLRRRGG